MISRRRFLQATTAAGALMAFPYRAFPFSQSVLQIPKFRLALPGLGDTGIPVLTATEEDIGGVMTDVYEINVAPFEQDLLQGSVPGVGPQKLWGYSAPGGPQRYLGGVIVANFNKPVRLIVHNQLPQGPTIMPFDSTLIDPVVANQAGIMRQDRIAIHLHGGFVFWQFDGGPFHWFSSATNAVAGPSFINGELGTAPNGTAIYDYPNGQSARTIWYHDHAYGITRTNVYAGQASAYLITDDQEAKLISTGAIPGSAFSFPTSLVGVPLIIQDKTFWDPASDPTYIDVVPGAVKGDLWYPHVYEGGLDPTGLPPMQLPATSGGVPNPKARWGTPDPALSLTVVPSSVPEFFSDTILVNGAPYPTLNVTPQRYRFRFLNASQGRVYNLQLYVADGSKDGITLKPIAPFGTTILDNLDNNDNVLLMPENAAGPAFVQIANEAGFLPEPAIFSTAADGLTNVNSNQIIKYRNASSVRTIRSRADGGREIAIHGDRLLFRLAPGDPTDGNVALHNLVMAPAERPDVIIDFRGFEDQDLILYNDAPAPFPGGDTRNDYFSLPDPAAVGLPTGYNDQTVIGGAPPNEPGFGPDTRILMKIHVSGAGTAIGAAEPDFPTWVTTLKTALKAAFGASQPAPFTDAQLAGAKTVVKVLGEDNDENGRLRQYLGTPTLDIRTYLDFPTDVALEGEVQVWQIYNTTADTHPMHFHLVNVQVIGRQQWAFNPDGTPVLPLQPLPDSTMAPPDPNEMGWRETVRMNPGEITTVAMKFDLPGTPPPGTESPRLLASYGVRGFEYVWHCHILEHEEHDMMRPVVVVASS